MHAARFSMRGMRNDMVWGHWRSFSPVPCKRRADPPPSRPAEMNGPPLLLRLVLPLLCLLLAEPLRDRYADPKFMEGCVCGGEAESADVSMPLCDMTPRRGSPMAPRAWTAPLRPVKGERRL